MKTVIDIGSVNNAYSSNIGRQLTILGTDRDCGTWELGRHWRCMVYHGLHFKLASDCDVAEMAELV